VYEDEVHFEIETTITAGWFKKGSKPTVNSKPSKEKILYSGIVMPNTGLLFTQKSDRFNYASTISAIKNFVECKPAPFGKKYLLILDNAPWHKKAYRLIYSDNADEYEFIRNHVDFLFLPPYSPDLNPIEQVWRITRRENTHNRYFSDLSTLTNVVDGAFVKWSTPNQQLQSLCGGN